jgi:hypothetical protein
MLKSKHQPLLVQKLITSYFPATTSWLGLLSLSTELGSVCCTVYTNNSDSHYVSATLVSKQGDPDFYLGKCNTLEEFRGRPLFMHADSTHAYSYLTSSFDLTPSFSDVRFSIGSPITSSESVVFRNWCAFLWLRWVFVSSFTYYAYWSFTYF